MVKPQAAVGCSGSRPPIAHVDDRREDVDAALVRVSAPCYGV
jgi:hypothetical protein